MTFDIVHLTFLLCHIYITFMRHFNKLVEMAFPQENSQPCKLSFKSRRIQSIGSLRILIKNQALSVFQACLLKKNTDSLGGIHRLSLIAQDQEEKFENLVGCWYWQYCWTFFKSQLLANDYLIVGFCKRSKDVYFSSTKFEQLYISSLNGKFSGPSLQDRIKPFSTNILLLYPLKTSVNLRFAIFRGYRSGTLVENGLMTYR